MNKIVALVKKHPILVVLIGIQIILMVYFNLFEQHNYLGFDASVYFLQVIESWKQKTLFLNHWVDTTTLALDSQIPLAVLLYGLIGNVYVAMGLSNIITIVLFALVMALIQKERKATENQILLFLALLWTPFISTIDAVNSLDYFSMMYFGCAGYLLRITICFFLFYVFYTLDQKRSNVVRVLLLLLSMASCFISAMSSGYFVLAFAVVPMVLYYLVVVILQNKWDIHSVKQAAFIGAIVIASFLGRGVQHFYGFQSRDAGLNWVTLEQFWENLGSIFTGYMALLGSIPLHPDVGILTITGIGYVIRMVIAIATIIAFLTKVNKIRRFPDKLISLDGLLLCTIVGQLFVFTICYTRYSSPIFEYRYLIVIHIILMIFLAEWIYTDLLHSDRSYFKFFAYICVLVSIVMTNGYSYYYLNASRNNYEQMKNIAKAVQRFDVPVVYMNGSELEILSRNMRVVDSQRIYKNPVDLVTISHWGDYTFYDDAGEYDGKTVVLSTEESFLKLPIYFQNKYQLQTKIQNTDIGLYLCDENPVDLTCGIVGDYSVDYFYTYGISTYPYGSFDIDGNFVTDGTEGFATWGPYCAVPKGKYKFTLNYVVVGNDNELEEVGEFDLAVDSERVEMIPLSAKAQSVTLEMDFGEYQSTSSSLEYRCYVMNGVKLKLISVEIEKVSP